MDRIVCKDYDELSKTAAKVILDLVKEKPNAVIGLLTGSTPIGMYRELSNSDADFSGITTFNLDEYLGLDRNNDQSYYYFMNENLYKNVNLKKENINIPNGMAPDLEAEAKAYDERIDEKGGLDLMVLGIGPNGHIGFNEPDGELVAGTHVVNLTEETINANARFFSSKDEVPKKAITMGMASILKAKKILLLISGASKKQVACQLLEGKITTENPATFLLVHPAATTIIDNTSL